jgi:hypothetical protein
MESAGVTRSYMEIVPFMNMEIISRRRTELMGFAAIWIAVLHGPLWFRTVPLSLYKASGYCGVEMFLFLSAFGLYYSYHSRKTTAVEFFRRRLMRLLPAVIAVSLFSMIVMNNKIWNMLSCYWLLGFFWRKDVTAWFLPAIIVLYAVSPLYLKYFNRRPGGKDDGGGHGGRYSARDCCSGILTASCSISGSRFSSWAFLPANIPLRNVRFRPGRQRPASW